VHCGCLIEAPSGLSYDRQLIWALGHPDGDRAVTAARILGLRRAREAGPALREAVIAGREPFVAAEALRSLIAMEGAEQLTPWLEELACEAPFMISAVARPALDSVA
jgi:hypothetical protein